MISIRSNPVTATDYFALKKRFLFLVIAQIVKIFRFEFCQELCDGSVFLDVVKSLFNILLTSISKIKKKLFEKGVFCLLFSRFLNWLWTKIWLALFWFEILLLLEIAPICSLSPFWVYRELCGMRVRIDVGKDMFIVDWAWNVVFLYCANLSSIDFLSFAKSCIGSVILGVVVMLSGIEWEWKVIFYENE